ncbi:MAG: ABC transporter permease [Planctomycetaceae bacterium]|nr:ABC transporter permease [Planctomycetaceae bacterium]
MTNPDIQAELSHLQKSPGFWKETWLRFRQRKLAMLALGYVVFLGFVAICSPAIVGTKPVICKYKGWIYFPALGYYNYKWENPVFSRDKFRRRYPHNLKEKDPESWAIWPLVYQDPERVVGENEWPGVAANPILEEGRPSWLRDSQPDENGLRPPVVLFGTTDNGIDVFAQMVHGTRTALMIGFVSMGIAATIGVIVGAFAGYFGGWVDAVLSRLIEVVMCVPTLVLILALLAIVDQPTIWHMMAVIGITGWTGIARLTRAEFLRLRRADFVAAAEVLGVSKLRIIFRHILPNALAPVLVPVTFGIASAILIETGLRFLSFGPPGPSWGSLLQEGRSNYEMWWLIVFPGLAIFSAVLAYNLIGEGLQEATDPRLREGGRD